MAGYLLAGTRRELPGGYPRTSGSPARSTATGSTDRSPRSCPRKVRVPGCSPTSVTTPRGGPTRLRDLPQRPRRTRHRPVVRPVRSLRAEWTARDDMCLPRPPARQTGREVGEIGGTAVRLTDRNGPRQGRPTGRSKPIQSLWILGARRYVTRPIPSAISKCIFTGNSSPSSMVTSPFLGIALFMSLR